MTKHTVTHGTYTIERNYPVPPEKVFGAFTDPAKKRRWFAEDGGTPLEEFVMDFRIGGSERTRSRFTGDGPLEKGTMIENFTTYHDIIPDQRIVAAYSMTVGDTRISTSLTTYEFLPANHGTVLVFTEQAAFFEGADGIEIREQGWRQLLAQLATHIERQN